MKIQSPMVPLSSVYLNLLQARPVSPVAPVARPAASGEAQKQSSLSGAADRPAANTSPTRGRIIDIIA